MREIAVFALSMPLVLYLFRENGVEIAADELRWAVAIIGAIGVVLLVEFLVRVVSVPAMREASLKGRLADICPDDIALTGPQRALLGACGTPDRSTEYWFTRGSGGCRLGDVQLKNEKGLDYLGTVMQSHLELLESDGVVEIIHPDEYETSFRLTPIGCDILRNRLGVSHMVGGE